MGVSGPGSWGPGEAGLAGPEPEVPGRWGSRPGARGPEEGGGGGPGARVPGRRGSRARSPRSREQAAARPRPTKGRGGAGAGSARPAGGPAAGGAGVSGAARTPGPGERFAAAPLGPRSPGQLQNGRAGRLPKQGRLRHASPRRVASSRRPRAPHAGTHASLASDAAACGVLGRGVGFDASGRGV